ncbi:MAG: hypothetical protein M5U11_05860 [Anaerolineales bacterium]|nr:hypothetical protein [Anaerolineales bacterium]
MNPQTLFCPNMDCPARGHKGKGNIQVHSQKDQRCVCQVCGQTFTVTKGTIFYRLRHAPGLVIQVLILLAYGCPIQAIVRAFGLDERGPFEIGTLVQATIVSRYMSIWLKTRYMT